LRNALGDAASRPQYIQNQWGEGYRFIGEVEELDPGHSQKNFAAADGPLPVHAGKNLINKNVINKSRRLAFVLAAAGCVVLAGIAGWLLGH
jgi:DNA-binding winged helix-turn-helix (wHTH) protein